LRRSLLSSCDSGCSWLRSWLRSIFEKKFSKFSESQLISQLISQLQIVHSEQRGSAVVRAASFSAPHMHIDHLDIFS